MYELWWMIEDHVCHAERYKTYAQAHLAAVIYERTLPQVSLAIYDESEVMVYCN